MARLFKVACDSCEKEVDNVYNYIGWIIISGSSISITGGRKYDGMANTKFVNIPSGEMHFCSIQCLLDYFKALKFVKGE